MTAAQRPPSPLLQRAAWTLLVLAIAGIGAALAVRSFHAAERRSAEALPRIAPVGPFALVDQDGQSFTERDLAGKIAVVQFFFAECPGPCPAVSHQLAVLQPMLKDARDVRLVSISIDPAHDTPAVLRDYAKRVGAEPGRWVFLTGTPEEVARVVTKRFLVGFQPNTPAEAAQQGRFMHSTKVVLLDRQGTIRAYYDGLDLETPQHVLTDIGVLEREK